MTSTRETSKLCKNCGEPIQWVEAPPSYKLKGYLGYWFHPHSQHVKCYPNLLHVGRKERLRAEPTE